MEIKLVDVTIHIDETVDADKKTALLEVVRSQDGVIGVGYHDEKPHLMVVEYNPDRIGSADLLERVKGQGLHAELVGL